LAGDSVELVNVRQTDGDVLKAGTPAHFVVRIGYNLESRNEGVLTLSLDQSQRPESCVPDANAGWLKTVMTERVAISRGMHTVEIPVVWNGSGGTGAITLEASLWSKEPSYKVLTRWFGTQFCQRF
jgi:hypothetical protein